MDSPAAGRTGSVTDAASLIGVGSWHWDGSGGVVVDREFEVLLGVEAGQSSGCAEAVTERVHPDDRSATLRAVKAAIEAGDPFSVEHRVVWPDGTVRWIETRGRPHLDGDGRGSGASGFSWDVTDRAEALELAREESLAYRRRLADLQQLSCERLDYLTSINEVLVTAHDRREIMRGATSVAVPRLGEWCVIAVLPDDGGRVPDLEIAHVDPEMVALAHDLQKRIPYDPDARTGLANVIRSGVTEFYPEIDEEVLASADAPEEGKEVARQLELRSAILVPLTKQGRTIGAMQFVNSSHARHYTPDDVALAEAVASRVASSLENRRLSEMLRKNQFRAALDAMLDDVAISRAVRDDSGEIIDFVIEFMNANSSDGAGRGAADLIGQRVLSAYPRWRENGLFERFKKVVDRGEPWVVDRLRYEDETADGTPISGWWSIRVVPLDDGYLASSRDETAAVLAERELERSREQKERARVTLEVLQEAALPGSLPELESVDIGVRYDPADEALPVGGDWFDVLHLPERRLLVIVVADVAGHGQGSAGLMVQVRNAMRAFAVDGLDPGEVLTKTNRSYRATTSSSRLVTSCCLFLSLDSGDMTWSSAGHFDPVFESGGTVTELRSRHGIPLGIGDSHRYGFTSARLNPGDQIVLFTDGLIERRGETIDRGLQRLRATVAAADASGAQQLLDHIFVELLAEGTRRDDAVGVVVRFR